MTQVDADTLRKAHSVHPISSVEYQYYLFNRSIEKDILPTARELGIDVVAFGTLVHGLLGGTISKGKVDHSNAHIPLFHKENIEKNLVEICSLAKIFYSSFLYSVSNKQSSVLKL